MRTVRAGVKGFLRAFPGRYVNNRDNSIAARKRASKRPQGQKKTPENDSYMAAAFPVFSTSNL